MTAAKKQPDAKGIAKTLEENKSTKEIKKEFVVLDELNDLLDSLGEREFAELKKSIEEEGIREPIVIWKEKNAVVDGHNRRRVARLLNTPDKDIPFREKSFASIHEAKQWMLRNQLGRRNLTPQRFEYFIGKLYEETKQDPKQKRTDMGGEDTAKSIGKQFGIAERTVRRAAETAKGLDNLEKVKGKLAKITHLEGNKEYTKEELSTIGRASNTAVAKRVVDKIDKTKQATKEAKKAPPVPASSTYPVVFATPDFDKIGFNVTTEPKPPLDKDAIVYVMVPDEHMASAIKMVERWGLTYECSFIFKASAPYEGVWSKVEHVFMIAATKGTVTGPKAGNEAASIVASKDDAYEAMSKMIEKYHNGVKKLAVVGKRKVPQGWVTLAK